MEGLGHLLDLPQIDSFCKSLHGMNANETNSANEKILTLGKFSPPSMSTAVPHFFFTKLFGLQVVCR